MKSGKTICKELSLRILPEKVLLILKKIHYYRALRTITEEDEVDIKVVKHLVNQGDHVIDLGANIGVYSKFLCEFVGRSGHVYSVEPIPHTYHILCHNVKKLGLTNVEPINCAISSANGVVTMEVPLYESGGGNYYRATVIDGTSNKVQGPVIVRSRTIDSLFSRCPPISFVKCDVEGHELDCIKGAMNLIKKSKPACLIEISGDPDESTSGACEVFRRLANFGYEVCWFDGSKLRRRRFGDKSVNYFFLMPHHLKILEQKKFLVS